MRRWSRAFVYAALLFALLSVVAFRFYHSASQVELRLRHAIGSSLTVPVALEECRSDPFGAGLEVAAVRVPAAPTLDTRTLLALEDLRLEGSRGAAFRRGLRRRRSPAALELTRLRVGRARLVLEHERRAPLASRVGRWNFESLFRSGRSPAEFGHAPAEILVDEMVLLLRLLEGGAQPREWEIGFESVDVRPSEPDAPGASGRAGTERGLLLQGDLTEGEFWAGGQLRIEMLADGVVDVGGRIDDFRLLPRHWRLVPESWRRLSSDLDPTGAVDLTIETVRLSSREDVRVRIHAQHYDSGMRLGPGGARLKHLRGVVSITEADVRFGEYAGREPLEAELWGVAIRLDGLLSTAQQRLVVRVPTTLLQDVEFAAGVRSVGEPSEAGNLTGLTDALGPAGSVEGEITGDLFVDRGDTWKGSVRFRDFTLLGWPWIHDGAGHVDVTVTEDTRRGVIQVDRLGFARIGTLAGEVESLWSEDGVSLRSSALRVLDERTGGDGRDGPAARVDGGGASGTIFGTLAWSWTKGVTELDVRWMDLEFKTELFNARRFGGHIGRTDTAVGGVIECGATEIPTVLFGGEGGTWSFERGKGRIRIAGGNVWIPSMKLLGPEWSLRFGGKVHVSGDLDFVAVLAPAENYGFRLDDLDAGQPEAWKAQAGADFRIYKITGTIDRPVVRPLGPYDPLVVR